VPLLKDLLDAKTEEVDVLQQAAHSLGKIGGRAAMKHLLGLIQNPGVPPEIVLTSLQAPMRFWNDFMFASASSYDLIPQFTRPAKEIIDGWPASRCALIARQRNFQELSGDLAERILLGKTAGS
jgi:hypothetical protein